MKKFSVRLLSILLALTMLVTLTACGQDKPKADAQDNGTVSTTATTSATVFTDGESTTTTVEDTAAPSDTEDTADEDVTTTTEVADPTTEGTQAPTTTADKKPTTTAGTQAPATTTGTKKPVTGFIPSVPTTTTTTRTTKVTTTTTTKPEVPKKSIRVLAVGNSFSEDAVHNHLFKVLESMGYNDIILGHLYVAGCSIDTHWGNVNNMKKAYTYYETKPSNGVWKTIRNVTADKAFEKIEWDVITVQQVSTDSGRPGTFGNLGKLVGWLKEKNPDAKILYHMTWAYQKDSTHWAFAPYYGSDQMRMYNDIVVATRDTAAKTAGIQGVIPAGTAIQNLRTSSLGDTLTSDGHHLLNSYGDYTAAVTWAAYITGEDANKVTYRPDEIADHFDEIALSVNNAIRTPYSVTAC